MYEVSFETFSPEFAEIEGPHTPDTEAVDNQEQEFTRLDSELMPLVSANANVIVRCWWMGGAEVTLSEAVNNYYAIMTEENVDKVIADVLALLADPVTEKLEPKVQEPEPEVQVLDKNQPKNEEEPNKPKPTTQKLPAQKEPAIEPKATRPHMEQARPAPTHAEQPVVEREAIVPVVEEQSITQREPDNTKQPIAPLGVLVEIREVPPPITFEPVKEEERVEEIIESVMPPQPIAEQVLAQSGVEVIPVEDTLQIESALPLEPETNEIKVEEPVETQLLSDEPSMEPLEPIMIETGLIEDCDHDEAPAPLSGLDAYTESTYVPESLIEEFKQIDIPEPKLAPELAEQFEQVIKVAELAAAAVEVEELVELAAQLEALLVEFPAEQLSSSAPLLFAQMVLKRAKYFANNEQPMLSSPTHEFINEPLISINDTNNPHPYFVLGRSATQAYLLNFSQAGYAA